MNQKELSNKLNAERRVLLKIPTLESLNGSKNIKGLRTSFSFEKRFNSLVLSSILQNIPTFRKTVQIQINISAYDVERRIFSFQNKKSGFASFAKESNEILIRATTL